MSDPTDFDFAMSTLWRDALPAKFDRHMAPTRRTFPPAARFRDEELDDLRQEVKGWRSQAYYWQQKATEAEAEIRRLSARTTRQQASFEGTDA